MNSEAKVTLHNAELEREVLSNLMSQVGLMGQYQELLSEELFYIPRHRALYRAVKAVADGGDFPDSLNVGMYLMQHPDSMAPEAWEIAEISSSAVTTVNFDRNVEALSDLAKRRRYWLLGNRLCTAGTDLTVNIDEVDKEIDALREQNLQASKDVCDMKAVNEALTVRVIDNINGVTSNILPTGFPSLDERGGFQLSDLNLIGGATSMGKSTFATNVGVNVAKSGFPVLMFTLEMTVEQLAARINAPVCGVPSFVLRSKKLRTDQMRFFEAAKVETEKLPFYIIDNLTTYEKIRESIRANAIKRGVKLFIIDYLQTLGYFRTSHVSEASFYEGICRELKNIAKELKVCIALVVQFNRIGKGEEPRPDMS